MFEQCISLENIKIFNSNFGDVYSSYCMFYECSLLKN